MLNVAILGDGFFEVWLPDGRQAYTRNGRFKLASDGRRATVGSFPLLGGFQPILPGDESDIAITATGRVFVAGNSGRGSFPIVLTRFPNPPGLKTIGPNLFVATETSRTPETCSPGLAGYGLLIQGFLESLPE